MASAESRVRTELIRAAPGPPFAQYRKRRRPVGRIGGIAGPRDERTPAALVRLSAAVGSGSQLLDAERAALVADWDTCRLDDEPIADLQAWQGLLRRGELARVEGAFAIAFLEGDTLCLARDAIGERTLFYALAGERLVFASTLRAVLATGLVERRPYLPALARYLSYAYLPGPDTLAEGVRELLPGELLRFRGGRLESSRFWEVPAEPEGPPAPEEELRARLRSDLERAVSHRLPRGSAVGAFLSGGVDSSLVVALARRLHDAPVFTYSVSFGDGYANELPFSTMVAEHCGTEHRIVELSPRAVLHHLDDSIASLSDPIGDPLTVPNALLFREASEEVGVVLNGEGGDPCFGGPKNLPMLLAELYGGTDEDGSARERSYLRAHQKAFDDLGAMLVPEAAAHARALVEELAPAFADPRWRTLVSRLMALNVRLKGAHHILPKVDAESAPFGMLPRSPLFDRRVVETAFTIPPQLKLKGSVEKYLLKQAVADLLPSAILERPKSGMLVPVEAWFSGPLLSTAKERLLDGLGRRGLFQRPYLEALLAGKLRGARPRRGAKIWLLVALEAWLRTVLDG